MSARAILPGNVALGVSDGPGVLGGGPEGGQATAYAQGLPGPAVADRAYAAGPVGGPSFLAPESFSDVLQRLHQFLAQVADEAKRFLWPPATQPPVPPAPLPAPPIAPPAPEPKPGPGGTYTAQQGDTLWRIATKVLGDGKRWPEIFELNRDKLSRPEDLQSGMVLRLPGGSQAEPPPAPKPPPPFNGGDIAAGLHIPPVGQNPDRATIDELLNRAADKQGIPRPILKAIALRESNWRQYDGNGNPVAGRNPTTTDWGLMQINDYWHPAAFPRGKTDIVYNLSYGADYLARQYKRYGNWSDAVAAYNAGSVQKDGSQYKNQAYVDFVLAHARSDWGYRG